MRSFDVDLNPLLEMASNDDLDPLIEYLNKNTSCTLSKKGIYKKNNPDHSKYTNEIAMHLRNMGGTRFANLLRGLEGPSYHEIVCSVAKNVEASFNKNHSIEQIEDAILEKILKKALDSMTDEEKRVLLSELDGHSLSKEGISSAMIVTIFRTGGFKSYQLTRIVANQIAKSVLGRSLIPAASTSHDKSVINTIGGKGGTIVPFALQHTVPTALPIGWLISSLLTVANLVRPACSVTLPCVIHIAMLRKKYSLVSGTGCDALSPETGVKLRSDSDTRIEVA